VQDRRDFPDSFSGNGFRRGLSPDQNKGIDCVKVKRRGGSRVDDFACTECALLVE
jgi:hypothetical protein